MQIVTCASPLYSFQRITVFQLDSSSTFQWFDANKTTNSPEPINLLYKCQIEVESSRVEMFVRLFVLNNSIQAKMNAKLLKFLFRRAQHIKPPSCK